MPLEPRLPPRRVPEASSTIFGVGALDSRIETVYGAKLATAQYPRDLRPKARSGAPARASQLGLKSRPSADRPGASLLLPPPTSPRPALQGGGTTT